MAIWNLAERLRALRETRTREPRVGVESLFQSSADRYAAAAASGDAVSNAWETHAPPDIRALVESVRLERRQLILVVRHPAMRQRVQRWADSNARDAAVASLKAAGGFSTFKVVRR
ncbi:MAG: DciA family protein [Planctomycetota bacterium]